MHGSVLGLFLGVLKTEEVIGKRVLEVGSLDVNGSVRPLIEARSPGQYLGIDVVAGPGVDRVMDAVDLRAHFGVASFDVVVCCETMEHVEDWRRSLIAMVQVLRPGGVLVITTRSAGFAYHHPPDRWRYTSEAFGEITERLGLELLLLVDDPEYPGVFWKVRKPNRWVRPVTSMMTALDGIGGVTPMSEPLSVLGLPANADGCGYYRMWQPFRAIQRAGLGGVVIPPVGQHQFIPTAREVGQFDIIVQQRPGGPAMVDAWEWWKARAPHTKLVFEADDWILDADTSLPHWQKDEVRATVRACLKLADLVTVSTELLAERYRAETAAPVAVLPNRIHAGLLDLARPVNPDPTAPVTLGWAGGQTHFRDLLMVQDPINAVLDSLPEVDMHWIGYDDPASAFKDRGRYTEWQPDVWNYYQAIDFDVAVIPLRSTPFNDCRSAIKALEYAALGIPVVASNMPAYAGFVEHGVTGYLASSEAEWHDYVEGLLCDPAARAEMSAAARTKAAGWTIQEHYVDWVEAYRSLTA